MSTTPIEKADDLRKKIEEAIDKEVVPLHPLLNDPKIKELLYIAALVGSMATIQHGPINDYKRIVELITGATGGDDGQGTGGVGKTIPESYRAADYGGPGGVA